MKLLKNDDIIIRVLMEQFEKSLIIDCIKRTMPKWVLSASLAEFWECAESELYERTGLPQKQNPATTPLKRRLLLMSPMFSPLTWSWTTL